MVARDDGISGREAKAMDLYGYASRQCALETAKGKHEEVLMALRQRTQELFPTGVRE